MKTMFGGFGGAIARAKNGAQVAMPAVFRKSRRFMLWWRAISQAALYARTLSQDRMVGLLVPLLQHLFNVTATMEHRNDPDMVPDAFVDNQVGVKRPEQQILARQFRTAMTQARHAGQHLECLVEFRLNAIGGFDAIEGDVAPNLQEIPKSLRRDNELSHLPCSASQTFFAACKRVCSSSPDIPSPRSSSASPRASFCFVTSFSNASQDSSAS